MWYHLILSDITYNQDDITLKLDDIILRRGDITLNRGDITSKARWYHILLINSKTAPHIHANEIKHGYSPVVIPSSCLRPVNVYCPFDYTAVAGSGKVGPVNQVNHTSWVAVVTPTDRPKSVHNRCLIELFCGVVCVVTALLTFPWV